MPPNSQYSTSPAPSRNATSPSWNPASILEGDMGLSHFTCVGITQKNKRCRNPIAGHNIDNIHRVLEGIQCRHYRDNLDDLLHELAYYALCRRWHSREGYSQVERMVGIWKQQIARFSARRQQARSSSTIVSRPSQLQQRRSVAQPTRFEYLPTPPQSRPTSPPPLNATNSRNPILGSAISPARPNEVEAPLVTTGVERNDMGVPSNLEWNDFVWTPDWFNRVSQGAPEAEVIVVSEDLAPPSLTSSAATTAQPSADANILEDSAEDQDIMQTEPQDDQPSATEEERNPENATQTVSTIVQDQGTPAQEEEQPQTPRDPCPHQTLHRSRRQRLPDNCIICYESIERTERLAFCKSQCGQNFHHDCLQIWLESDPRNIPSCPFCRAQWDSMPCSCDTELPEVENTPEEAPVSESPHSYIVLDYLMNLVDAIQANLLLGPLPPPPR